MKFILYARSLQNELYSKMGLKLLSIGHEVVFVTNTIKEKNNILIISPKANIYVLEEFVKENWNNKQLLLDTSFDEIEKSFKISSIWSLIYTDRHLIQFSELETIKHSKLIIKFVKNVLSNNKSSYFVNEEIANFPAYLFYAFREKYNVKYLGFCVPRNYSSSKIAFTNNNFSTYYKLDSCYINNNINKQDIIKAKKFVSKFNKEKFAPEYMQISGKYPKFKAKYFLYFVKYLFGLLENSIAKSSYKFNFEKSSTKPSISIEELINFLKFQFQKKYYSSPIAKQKYILFPLHFQPEATTLVLAQNYEKQLNAIDLIAKKIPGKYVLYVKEHYARLGHRETTFYKALKKYPNVRLINPLIGIHDLILKSDGVITLSGTCGWEAMLLGKPVYLLGNVFYESFKYINKVDNIDKLTNSIKSTDLEFYKSSNYQDELIKYVACYLKTLAKGNYLLGFDGFMSDSNVDDLVKSLIKQVS